MQLIVALPDNASFKRDVSIDVSRKKIALSVSGNDVLVGDLAFDVVTAESEWFVEDDLDGFSDDVDARFLVVDLAKQESFTDWPAPLQGREETDDPSAAPGVRRVLIGGQGEAQKEATAMQLSSYQVLQKLPSAVRGDVYARAPAGADGTISMKLYFIGKVIAEAVPPEASLASQVTLVKEHARRYQPDVFGGASDDEIELWLAPGNSEMRVAQNELSLERWAPPAAHVELPAAGACGFEPETAPPPHMGAPVFTVERDAAGAPIGAAFETNVLSPDEVPGAYEAWLKDQ